MSTTKCGADLVGDLAHRGEVDLPRVRRVAGHQDQRPELPGEPGDLVVVEQAGLRVGAVRRLVEHLAGDVRPEPVREVAAGVERHADHALVAERRPQLGPVRPRTGRTPSSRLRLLERRRLDAVRQHRPERDQVGVDARVRLDVGVRRAEQRLGVVGGELLDGVDVLTAGVEAVADRALGVLVGHPLAHRQQHRRRGVVLAGDQLQRRALVGQLTADRAGHVRLDRGDHVEGVGVRRRRRRGIEGRLLGHLHLPAGRGPRSTQARGADVVSLPGGDPPQRQSRRRRH